MVGSIPLVVLGIAFASVSYAQEPARDERLPIRAAFADDQLQVFRVSLVPGASAQRSNHPDALLVSLTVDLDGRVPRDDAAWHAAGTTTLENRAKTRFDGILVDLAAPPLDVPAPLPPEVAADRISEYPSRYRSEDYRVRTVLDNPRVLVTWHRLPPWRPQRSHATFTLVKSCWFTWLAVRFAGPLAVLAFAACDVATSTCCPRTCCTRSTTRVTIRSSF
jgi:hypothetical protein